MRSRVTPPDTSIFARPAIRATASRVSSSDRLSSRMTSAPAAIAASTCCEALRFDLDRHLLAGGFHPLERHRDAAGEADVVVLDEDAVVQAAAMVAAAAGADGVLLERAQRRRGLAGIEDR